MRKREGFGLQKDPCVCIYWQFRPMQMWTLTLISDWVHWDEKYKKKMDINICLGLLY